MINIFVPSHSPTLFSAAVIELVSAVEDLGCDVDSCVVLC